MQIVKEAHLHFQEGTSDEEKALVEVLVGNIVEPLAKLTIIQQKGPAPWPTSVLYHLERLCR